MSLCAGEGQHSTNWKTTFLSTKSETLSQVCARIRPDKAETGKEVGAQTCGEIQGWMKRRIEKKQGHGENLQGLSSWDRGVPEGAHV